MNGHHTYLLARTLVDDRLRAAHAAQRTEPNPERGRLRLLESLRRASTRFAEAIAG